LGYLYLEVRCLGCDAHQTVALDIVRRPKTTPIHEMERSCDAGTVRRCGAISLQAQPSGRAASDEDISERPAVDMVAGRAVNGANALNWILASSLSLLVCPTGSSQAEPEKARLGRLAWIAFEYATYARLSGQSNEQTRLSDFGVESSQWPS
jgi:hypothetical protein